MSTPAGTPARVILKGKRRKGPTSHPGLGLTTMTKELVEVTSSRGSCYSCEDEDDYRFPNTGLPPDASWEALPGKVQQSHEPAAACVALTVLSGADECYVGEYAFRGLCCIHTAIVPAVITRIGVGSFEECAGLVDVRFAARNFREELEIGAAAFEDCKSLPHVSIPEGTTNIYGAAFSGCESLRTVELPASLAGPLGGSDGLAYNGYVGAFSNCGKLKEVTVNGGAPALAAILCSKHHVKGTDSNFHGCADAMLMLPPISVRTLAGDQHTVTGMQLAAWPEAARQEWREQQAERSDRWPDPPATPVAPPLPDIRALVLAQHPGADIGSDPTLYELLDGNGVPLSPKTRFLLTGDAPAQIDVTSSHGDIYECEGWHGLPEEVRAEGYDPAAACVVLTVTPGCTELKKFAFQRQSCIRTVLLPASIEHIWTQAFCGCSGLAEVRFAEGSRLKTIGNLAFAGCVRLEHVSIPEGTTDIHAGAFRGCTSLRSVSVPATLASPLGKPADNSCFGKAFAECGMLQEVKMAGGNAALAAVLGSPHQNELPCDEDGVPIHDKDEHGESKFYFDSGPNFRGSPDAMLVLTALTIRTLAGDEYPLDGLQIPAWPETAREEWRGYKPPPRESCNSGDPSTPAAPPLPADLNVLLSAQHPGTDLADPTQYQLLTAAAGSTDTCVPLSPLIRGTAGAEGLQRLFRGELVFDSVVALFVEQPKDEE